MWTGMKQLEREADLFCSSFYSSSMALQPNLNLGHFNLPPPGISISAPSIFRLRASLSPPLQPSASGHLYLRPFNLPPLGISISVPSIFRLWASLSPPLQSSISRHLYLRPFNLPPPGISISAPSIFRLQASLSPPLQSSASGYLYLRPTIFRLRASLSPPLQSSASRHLYLHLFNLPPSDVFISTSSIFRLQASLSSSVLHLLHFSVLLTLLSTTSNHILLVFPIVLLHSMYPFSAQLPQ